MKEGKRLSVEVLFSRKVDEVIHNKIIFIQNIIDEYNRKLNQEAIFASPSINMESIIEESIQELDKNLSESAKEQKTVYNEFIERVKREISDRTASDVFFL